MKIYRVKNNYTTKINEQDKEIKEFELPDDLISSKAKIKIGYIGGYELLRDGTQYESFNTLKKFINEYIEYINYKNDADKFENFLKAVIAKNIDKINETMSEFLAEKYSDGGGDGWVENFNILYIPEEKVSRELEKDIYDIDLLKEECQNKDLQVPLYQKICKLGEEAGEVQSAFLVYDNARNKSGSTTKEAEEKTKELLLIEEVLDTILVAEDIIYKIQKENNIPQEIIDNIKLKKYQKWYNKIQKLKG